MMIFLLLLFVIIIIIIIFNCDELWTSYSLGSIYELTQ